MRTKPVEDLCAYLMRASGWFLACLLAQGRMEPGTHIRWERNWLRTAENLNGLLGLIHNHRAIFAMLQMLFKFLLHDSIKVSVDVVRQLADDALAIQ